jgi:WD40 repeat protein
MSIAFDAWKGGHVAPTQHEIHVVAPQPGPKLEAVSPRLKGELIHPNRRSRLLGIRFSPDGKHIIAGDDPGGVVVVWDAATGQQRVAIETGRHLRGNVETYFYLSPHWERMFVAREDRKVDRVEQNGKLLWRWKFSGDVRAWNLATGRLEKTFQQEPRRGIATMRLSPDGTKFITYDWLSGTYPLKPDSAVSLWDVCTGRHRTLPGKLHFYAGFSPDGKTVEVWDRDKDGYTHALKLIETSTGKEKVSIPIRDKNATAFGTAFSPSGRLMAGAYTIYERPKNWDKSRSWVKWWNTTTGHEVLSFATGADMVLDGRFAPDGRTFAMIHHTGQKTQLLLFDVRTRQIVKSHFLPEVAKGSSLLLFAPAFRPDGKWLALITQVVPKNGLFWEMDRRDLPQPRILLIEVAAGAISETLVAPQGLAYSACSFSPDGRTLATGGHGRVLLWDVAKLPRATERARPPK